MTKMDQVIGRPRKEIDKDEIDILRRSGLKWIDISLLIGISKSSLQRWRESNNYEVPSMISFRYLYKQTLKSFHTLMQAENHNINLDILDSAIEDYTVGHPERGERMITGMIRATQGNAVTRSVIRSSIARVDQVGLESRRAAFGRRIVRYAFYHIT